MAHFVNSKTTAPAGDWTAVTIPTPAWLTSLDQQLFKAVNGDDGGTWAPSTAIIIGGSGLSVTGPMTASNITSATLNGVCAIVSGGIIAATSTTCTWQSGSTLSFASGATLNVNGTAAFGATSSVSFSGPCTFGGTTWPLIASRSVTRVIPLRMNYGTVAGSGAYPTHSNQQLASVRTNTGILEDVLSTTADFSYVPLDNLPDQQVLASITIELSYSALPAAFARFSLVKFDIAGTETTVSGPITDSTQALHTISLTVGTTIDTSLYEYALRVQSCNPAGTVYTITGINAIITATSIRVQ